MDQPSSETTMVEALRRGDQDVFRRLVEELNPGLTRMARTYASAAVADEVVQETWMAVVTSIGKFEGRSTVKTWVYRIMLNKVRTVAPREARIVPFSSVGPADPDYQGAVDPALLVDGPLGRGYWPEAGHRWDLLPQERLDSIETMRHVHEFLNRLPDAQREVVTLRDIEGWSSDEICNALGISSVNQRVLLHRGRAAVRVMLEAYLS